MENPHVTKIRGRKVVKYKLGGSTNTYVKDANGDFRRTNSGRLVRRPSKLYNLLNAAWG